MTLDERKNRAARWFMELRDLICAEFERLEDEVTAPNDKGAPGRFERRDWTRPERRHGLPATSRPRGAGQRRRQLAVNEVG